MAAKPTQAPSNYGVLSWGYNEKVVLPLQSALAILAQWENAEAFAESYNSGANIAHVGGKLFAPEFKIISQAEYVAGKMLGPKETNS